MAYSARSKLICLSVLLTVVSFCQVWARPNANYGTQDNRASNTMVLRSHHKGKRAWDLPYASDTQDDPVISLVEEGELGKDTTSNDPSGPADKADSMWLDIGKDFPESKTITLNQDGVLECEAVGSPPPKIFWLKNGMPVESMTIVTNDESVKNRLEIGNNVLYDKFGHSGMANVKSKLPIKCAQPEDQALYTCVAINRGKQVSATTRLSVIAEDSTTKVSRGSCEYRLAMFSYKKTKKGSSASVISSESFHMETMGRHIVLPCRSVGKPRPQVYWLDQDGKKIVSGKKYQVSSSGSLVVRNLAWKDMGVFTCVAENIFGKDTATTFVYPLSEEPSES